MQGQFTPSFSVGFFQCFVNVILGWPAAVTVFDHK